MADGYKKTGYRHIRKIFYHAVKSITKNKPWFHHDLKPSINKKKPLTIKSNERINEYWQ